jgi:hypothetical protein
MKKPLHFVSDALNKQTTKTLSVVALSSAMVACGGGGSDNPTPEPDTASFSLAVSDAPVDQANAVVVYFNTVELIGPDGPITFDVRDENNDPQAIDLLNYQGEAFVSIVDATEIPTGTYTQLRLEVTEDSYIEMDSGTFELKVPSNELKLDGIEALPGVEAAYTVEFDLRKSLVDPVGQPNTIFINPRGVRLVANDSVGTLLGTVSPALMESAACAEKIDLTSGNAVYVYEGDALDPTLLGDDADAPANTGEISPYTVANVTYNEDSKTYEFVAGYLPGGSYTVGFSCLALNDEPETDESADVFSFQAVVETSVTATEQTSIDIQ